MVSLTFHLKFRYDDSLMENEFLVDYPSGELLSLCSN
jgi:hypothetical protein